MKAVPTKKVSLTPWHLRERASHLRHELAKTVQSNFFYSFLFLPKAKRDAIIDIYRFCREIDDIVDDIVEQQGTLAQAQTALDEWRADLAALYAGQPRLPIAHRLQRVLAQFPMPKEYFEEMISGCEMDLQRHRYETFEELYEYCYRVASITGLMCIEIFTYRSPQTREYAINLGLALQLTNILRDLKEDAARGRVYLPQEDLRRFGYREEDLHNSVINPQFLELMRFECERARAYYRRADALLPREDRATLVAARTMGKIYYRLLQQIERVNYDVFNHQVRLHRPERFLIAFREWAKASVEERGRSGTGKPKNGGAGKNEPRSHGWN
jgi:phytoene synthase